MGNHIGSKETCHSCGNLCVDLPNGGRSVSILETGKQVIRKLPIGKCKVKELHAEHVSRLLARTIIDLEESR